MQHPFFMMLGGTVVWFAIKFSWFRNKNKQLTVREFWSDQYDEVVVCVIFGLSFITWDDEILTGYYLAMHIIKDAPHPSELSEGHFTIYEAYYLFCALIADNLYMIPKKFTK